MTHTHMQQVTRDLKTILSDDGSQKGLLAAFRSGKSEETRAAKIRKRLSGCVICEQVDSTVSRYAYTIAQLYGTNAEFQRMFDSSKGFCLPHLALVLDLAQKTLPAAQADTFAKAVAAVELPNLERLSKELEWFTLKYDFRNADKPWGNSRDAVERSINKLMGACVGEEAKMPAHND